MVFALELWRKGDCIWVDKDQDAIPEDNG